MVNVLAREYNSRSTAKSAEKLSSGYKINRAADDAAGLAISEKMRRQIRGLRQGANNTTDGISWVKIGDGAMNEVSDILNRMVELSVKAANSTVSDNDRQAVETLDSLSSACNYVSSKHALYGALQNRLEHTYDNLLNITENTTAAESRIRDTDMAKEMILYSNYNNILQQTGQAMLAQANQSTRGVMSLLS